MFSHAYEVENVINPELQSLDESIDKRRYSMPESCKDPLTHNLMKQRLFDKLLQVRDLEKPDPTLYDEKSKAFR